MSTFDGSVTGIFLFALLVLLAATAAWGCLKLWRMRMRLRMFEAAADSMMQNAQGLILYLHSIASALSPDDPTRQGIEAVIQRAQDQLSAVRERIEYSCTRRDD